MRGSWLKILLVEPPHKKPQLQLPYKQQVEKSPKLRLKQRRKKKPRKLLSEALSDKAQLRLPKSLQLNSHKVGKNNLLKTWHCNVKVLTYPQCAVLSVRALWKDWLALVWARLLVREKVLQLSVTRTSVIIIKVWLKKLKT